MKVIDESQLCLLLEKPACDLDLINEVNAHLSAFYLSLCESQK